MNTMLEDFGNLCYLDAKVCKEYSLTFQLPKVGLVVRFLYMPYRACRITIDRLGVHYEIRYKGFCCIILFIQGGIDVW